MSANLVHTLLLTLCSNYPISNITPTTPPPWKWVPERVEDTSNDTFNCILKNSYQITQELLKGRRLRIATLPNREPISYVTRTGNGTLKGEGIAFEIVNTLSSKFGFTYDVLIPARKTLTNEEGSIINMLLRGEADMVAAFIPMLPGMEDEITWGVQLSHYEYVIMMKRPKESSTGSGLSAPFEIEVWLLILLSMIIVGPVIYGMMVLRSHLCGGSKIYPISSCAWFVYGALMRQGSSLSPDNDSIRIIFATWWIFIMILTAFYTANLTAFLTLSKFTLPVENVDDVALPAYRWASIEGDTIEYSVKVGRDLQPLKYSWAEGRGQFVSISDDYQIRRLISNEVLFLHDRDWLQFFMLRIERDTEQEKEHCKYVLTEKPYLTRPLSFVFPKHSILPLLFNQDMLSYTESGIIKHLLTKNLPDAVICPLNLGSKERQLRNTDLLTTYAVVLTGYSIATIIFITEITVKMVNNKKISKNMKIIKTRRIFVK